jgi:hypothetical protein
MREVYRLQPDSTEGCDTWDLPEEWDPNKDAPLTQSE